MVSLISSGRMKPTSKLGAFHAQGLWIIHEHSPLESPFAASEREILLQVEPRTVFILALVYGTAGSTRDPGEAEPPLVIFASFRARGSGCLEVAKFFGTSRRSNQTPKDGRAHRELLVNGPFQVVGTGARRSCVRDCSDWEGSVRDHPTGK